MNNRRIRSNEVQLGEAFVVGSSKGCEYQMGGSFDDSVSKEEVYFKLKEKEFKDKLDGMLGAAQHKASEVLNKARDQAANIVQMAETETKRKLEEAETQKQQVFEEARQQGAALGHQEGYQQGQHDIYGMVVNLEAIADATFDLKKEIILSAEQEILQLSILVAERILKKQLEIKPEMVNEIIKAAINELKDKEEIKIIINPALKEQLYNVSEELKTAIKGLKTIKIVEDKTIHPDSAIVESPESRIDARIETQVAKITEELMQSFQEEPAVQEIIEQEEAKTPRRRKKKKEEDTSF